LDDDDAGEWITQENLYSYINHGDTQVLNLIKDDPKPIMGEDSDDCPPLNDAAFEDKEEDADNKDEPKVEVAPVEQAPKPEQKQAETEEKI